MNKLTTLISKALFIAAATTTLFGYSISARAQASDSPVGLWKTIDDETKQARSLVRISESNGVVTGKVEKLLTPGRENAVCSACEGDLKDKPITGMTILSGMKKNDDVYDGGTIFDAGKGKTYRSRLKVVDGGKQLEVRGYVGPVYRTQVWVREQ